MPSRIVAGLGLSHVPSVGVAYDRGKMQTPAWKPLADAYVPVRSWLKELQPDVAIVIYNDHGADFMFDKYPTFAIGAAGRYAIADEGFGTRALPEVRGDVDFSFHLCESLIADEFDLTVCQELAVEHGFLVPMNLCFEHGPDGWPVAAVPLQVNVIQHPLPTGRRCFKLGQAIRKAVCAYEGNLKVVVMGTGGMSHHELMEKAGAEAVELIMWHVMRGALSPKARRVHRHYYAPMTTGMGLITFDDQASAT